MKTPFFIIWVLLQVTLFEGCNKSLVTITRLTCEYLENPLGIDEAKPRLSWQLKSDERWQKQTAFHLMVASSHEKLDQNTGELWDTGKGNFPVFTELMTVEGAWNVSFDPKWGGPEEIKFEKLQDWTEHEMRGIKYYSGIATYKKSFDINTIDNKNSKYYIDLGVVNDIARVKLNKKDIGVVWCAPWRIEISGVLKEGSNELEIEVANRWINRLLGDRLEPDANVRTVKFENGLLGGKEFTTGRYTFTLDAAMRSFRFTEPLSSGLLGPVTIEKTNW